MRLIIADDHAIVRKGLVQILQLEDEIKDAVIDEVESGAELLQAMRKNKYNLIILDLSMPGESGLEILNILKAEGSKVPVLVLSTYGEEQYAVRCLKSGAAGYFCKRNPPDELINAIKIVLRGKKYFSSDTAEMILNMDSNASPHEMLTNREYEIFCKLAKGKTQTAIAEELYLSIKTVSAYRKRILEKMGFEDNSQITAYCLANDLI